MSYVAKRQPLAGFWSWVNTAIPSTRFIYNSGEAAEPSSGAVSSMLEPYLELQQEELARRAEAERAAKAKEEEQRKPSSDKTLQMVAIGAAIWLVFFKR